MSEMDTNRVRVDLVEMHTLQRESISAPRLRRVTFRVTIDSRESESARSEGFDITTSVAADFYDDTDVLEIARSRLHSILAAAEKVTLDWDRDPEWFKARRIEPTQPT